MSLFVFSVFSFGRSPTAVDWSGWEDQNNNIKVKDGLIVHIICLYREAGIFMYIAFS